MSDHIYFEMNEQQGTIKISEDVIASIASITTTETEGVSGIHTRFHKDFSRLLGKKHPHSGVQITLEGQTVSLELWILVQYGFNVREVATHVQKNVASAIQSMTGLTVTATDIHIAGISFARPAQKPAPASVPAETEEEAE